MAAATTIASMPLTAGQLAVATGKPNEQVCPQPLYDGQDRRVFTRLGIDAGAEIAVALSMPGC